MKSEQCLPLTTECIFRVSKKQFQLIFGGRTHLFKLSRGMKYLLALLTHPGIPISVYQLDACHAEPREQYRQFNNPEELAEQNLQAQDRFSRIAMADYTAIKEAKQTLLYIISELAEMTGNCDCARAEDLCAERDALQEYLREVYRPNGEIRSFGDESIRLRMRVLKSLRRALSSIEQCEPLLAKELRSCLELHSNLVYRPRELEINIYGFQLV